MADGNVAIIEEETTLPVQRMDYDLEDLTFAQRVALDPTIDVERLEKIIEMERNSERYAAEKSFSLAMAEMQPKLPAVEKTGDNKHLKSKYAKLEDIQKAVKPLLAEHGFAVRWTSETIDARIHVTCIITHRDGHSERDTLPLPVLTQNGTNALQQHGVTMSYGKRYTLCNVLGIQLGGEDSDGELTPLTGKTLLPEQVAYVRDGMKTLGQNDDAILMWASQKGFGATELENVPIEAYPQMKGQIDHWIKVRGKAND